MQNRNALLKNKLQMPLIVRDLLVTNSIPAADAEYGLHEMMSNFECDQALLCAAFTMQEVAAAENATSTDLSLLNMECERLIERYSARSELEEENHELWTETQADMLPVMAEDMEGFIELLSLCQMSFEIMNPKTAKIVSMIMTQLQSHLMIIDEVVGMLETQEKPKTMMNAQPYADNVLSFPG